MKTFHARQYNSCLQTPLVIKRNGGEESYPDSKLNFRARIDNPSAEFSINCKFTPPDNHIQIHLKCLSQLGSLQTELQIQTQGQGQ